MFYLKEQFNNPIVTLLTVTVGRKTEGTGGTKCSHGIVSCMFWPVLTYSVFFFTVHQPCIQLLANNSRKTFSKGTVTPFIVFI